MNREAYRLANEIRTELEAEGDCLVESLGDMDMRKYETAVLGEIRKEKRAKRRNFRSMAVAACAAVAVLTGAAVFGEEVHAAIPGEADCQLHAGAGGRGAYGGDFSAQ